MSVRLMGNKLIEKEEKGIYGYNFYLTNPVCYST